MGTVPMASSIKLDVPLVAQARSMSCWYAAACMVSYYFRAGPRLGLPAKWMANKGITPNDFIALAEAEGLEPLPEPRVPPTPASPAAHNGGSLYAALRTHGPIWCAGYWYGPGHVIVLTGIDGSTIYLNDPDGGVEKTATVPWFNAKVAKLPGAMLRKDKNAY
jgi:Papain-like cysteine protease AvrRpt2